MLPEKGWIPGQQSLAILVFPHAGYHWWAIQHFGKRNGPLVWLLAFHSGPEQWTERQQAGEIGQVADPEHARQERFTASLAIAAAYVATANRRHAGFQSPRQ